jgi:hypothetical protein
MCVGERWVGLGSTGSPNGLSLFGRLPLMANIFKPRDTINSDQASSLAAPAATHNCITDDALVLVVSLSSLLLLVTSERSG